MSANPDQLISYIFDAAIAACGNNDSVKAGNAVRQLIKSINFEYRETAVNFFNVYRYVNNNLIKGIYAWTMNACREYGKAEKFLNDLRLADQYNDIALSTLRTTYHLQGKYDKAINIWKESYRNDSIALNQLTTGYENGGYQKALQNLAELMIERSKTKFITPWRICTMYTRAGMKEEALDYLEKAYDTHDQNMPSISVDPIFDLMRDDPRFQAIITKMNFPS